MKDLCVKPICPENYDQCAGFLCVPKSTSSNFVSCASAIWDIASKATKLDEVKNVEKTGQGLYKQGVKTAEAIKKAKEAAKALAGLKDLITLLKAGDAILLGDVLTKVYALYQAGAAVYELF